MSIDWTFVLIVSATATIGLLAGASLDQSIKHLPTRHKIGLVAYSQYSRASVTQSIRRPGKQALDRV